MQSYIPLPFQETRKDRLLDLVRSHPLCTLVTVADGEPIVSHLPAIVREQTTGLILEAHVARANPIWRIAREQRPRALAIFSGPHAYVSPGWYPSKQRHGKAVPTWNYAAVHARGRLDAVEDREWLREHVTELSRIHESGREPPWSPADAPPDYTEKLLTAIVGLRMELDSFTGAYKLAQHKSREDREAVTTALESSEDPDARATAALMRAASDA